MCLKKKVTIRIKRGKEVVVAEKKEEQNKQIEEVAKSLEAEKGKHKAKEPKIKSEKNCKKN